MKECKGRCSALFCCNDDVYFGKSPGRCPFCNKHCTVCEYWITTAESKCKCCKNLLKLRKNWNMIEVVYSIIKHIKFAELGIKQIEQQPTLLQYLVPEITAK